MLFLSEQMGAGTGLPGILSVYKGSRLVRSILVKLNGILAFERSVSCADRAHGLR